MRLRHIAENLVISVPQTLQRGLKIAQRVAETVQCGTTSSDRQTFRNALARTIAEMVCRWVKPAEKIAPETLRDATPYVIQCSSGTWVWEPQSRRRQVHRTSCDLARAVFALAPDHITRVRLYEF